MTESSTIAASGASVKSPIPTATLVPVPCAPWCRDGDGHTDAWHQEDQYCSSEGETFELDAEPLNTLPKPTGERLAWKQSLETYLSRDAWSTRTLVNVSRNGCTAIHLTPAEAIALGESLARIGRQAESSDIG
jgi:hypothetical protein